jgi:hypothetical protein
MRFVLAGCYVTFGLLNAALQLWANDGELTWIVGMWLGWVLMGGLAGWAVIRERVVADDAGMLLAGLVRTREFPWEEIAEVRPDTPPPWSQWLVLETHSGEVVNLRLEATETGPVERWRQEAGGMEES